MYDGLACLAQYSIWLFVKLTPEGVVFLSIMAWTSS